MPGCWSTSNLQSQGENFKHFGRVYLPLKQRLSFRSPGIEEEM